MTDDFCICFHKAVVERPVKTWSTLLEFLALMVTSAIGLYLNNKFLSKLEKERRETPLGRKGNVIAPIMRWFLNFQVVFWPFNLLYRWFTTNDLLFPEMLPTWLCYFIPYSIAVGRQIIAYNSLFCAIIRYIFIVHRTRANQWSFEILGKLLRNMSVVIPLVIVLALMPLDDLELFKEWLPEFESCWRNSNATHDYESFKSVPYKFVHQYLPSSLHQALYISIQLPNNLVYFGIPEAFLYFRIFRNIKR